MNSEWFLFKSTHHVGPFTSQEIETMFKRGDISQSVLIWREGLSSWDQLHKIKEFHYLFKGMDLPPLPIDSEAINENIPAVPNVSKKKLPAPITTNLDFEDDTPPPLPLDVLEKLTKKVESQNEKVDIKPKKFNKIKGVESSDHTKTYLVVISAVLFGLFIWQFVLQKNSDIHFKIRNIMPQYVEKLESAAISVSPTPKVAMALAMDGRTLYIATSRSSEIDVSVKLTPVKRRVLGNDAGEIFVRGKIYDHLGEFDKVYLSNGLEFSPGEYDYIVHLNERHWINSYLPALSAIKFFRDLNKKFTVEGTDLIFASSPRDFDFKLTKFKTDSFNKLAKPLQDKIERINTIGALLDQMTLLFEETMNMSKSGKDFQKFEKVYQKDIGSVLQNLVTDRTNEFTAANEIIKSVAKLYATIVAKTSKLKKIESKFKVKIISEVKAESASIQLEVNKIKSSLETELNKLKM